MNSHLPYKFQVLLMCHLWDNMENILLKCVCERWFYPEGMFNETIYTLSLCFIQISTNSIKNAFPLHSFS